MIDVTDMQKIGIGLVSFGMFFLIFGTVLLFDATLLAMGNILFLIGVALIIGLSNTFRFFFQRQKVKGTSCFFGGIFLVLCKWAILGMIVEVFGFFYLFSGFFPVVIGFLRRIPIVNSIFLIPGANAFFDSLSQSKLPV